MPRLSQYTELTSLASHDTSTRTIVDPQPRCGRDDATLARENAVKPLTFSDLLAMQYRGDGTMELMRGRRHCVLITVFTRVRQPAVRVVVADAATQAIRARRYFFSLTEAVEFTNAALFR